MQCGTGAQLSVVVPTSLNSRNKRPVWLRFTMPLFVVGLSLALALGLRPSTYETPYLPFYLAVLVSLWYGGFGPGLLATVLSAVVVDWFFLPPYGKPSFDAISLLRGIFFCLSFGLICWLIDQRKVHAEARIERQLRLLDMAIEPIIVRDAEDRIGFWNTGAERLYGWSKEEAIGQNIHDLLRTLFPLTIESIRSELMESGRWHGELQHTRKDGSSVLVESWWTLEQTEGKQVAVMEANFDLTERKRVQSTLVQSEKLASVGRLAATIAHEVNNPLAAP